MITSMEVCASKTDRMGKESHVIHMQPTHAKPSLGILHLAHSSILLTLLFLLRPYNILFKHFTLLPFQTQHLDTGALVGRLFTVADGVDDAGRVPGIFPVKCLRFSQ